MKFENAPGRAVPSSHSLFVVRDCGDPVDDYLLSVLFKVLASVRRDSDTTMCTSVPKVVLINGHVLDYRHALWVPGEL